MGLYVEMMCDVRKAWPRTDAYRGKLENRCISDRSDNPQGHTIAEARREAKQQGWKLNGDWACCPNCWKKLEGE